MSQEPTDRVVVRVRNSTAAPLTLVLEPWANEYPVAADASLDVVETGGLGSDVLEVEVGPGRVTLFARGRAVMTVPTGEQPR